MGRALEHFDHHVVWPASRLPQALAALSARFTGQQPSRSVAVCPPRSNTDDESLDAWFSATAAALDIEIEPATLPYSSLDRSLRSAAPALLRAGSGFIALAGRGRLLTPQNTLLRVSPDTLAAAIAGPLDRRSLAKRTRFSIERPSRPGNALASARRSSKSASPPARSEAAGSCACNRGPRSSSNCAMRASRDASACLPPPTCCNTACS